MGEAAPETQNYSSSSSQWPDSGPGSGVVGLGNAGEAARLIQTGLINRSQQPNGCINRKLRVIPGHKSRNPIKWSLSSQEKEASESVKNHFAIYSECTVCPIPLNSSRHVSQPQECISCLNTRDAPDSSLSPRARVSASALWSPGHGRVIRDTEHAQWPGQWLGPARDPSIKRI